MCRPKSTRAQLQVHWLIYLTVGLHTPHHAPFLCSFYSLHSACVCASESCECVIAAVHNCSKFTALHKCHTRHCRFDTAVQICVLSLLFDCSVLLQFTVIILFVSVAARNAVISAQVHSGCLSRDSTARSDHCSDTIISATHTCLFHGSSLTPSKAVQCYTAVCIALLRAHSIAHHVHHRQQLIQHSA